MGLVLCGVVFNGVAEESKAFLCGKGVGGSLAEGGFGGVTVPAPGFSSIQAWSKD